MHGAPAICNPVLLAPTCGACPLLQCKSWSLRELDNDGEYVCRLWSTDDVGNYGSQITLEPGNRVPDTPENFPEKYRYTSGNSERPRLGRWLSGVTSRTGAVVLQGRHERPQLPRTCKCAC